MEIKHPHRILAVAAPGCSTLDVIKELTGSAPNPNEDGSAAGLTHEWDVKTAYYTAKVPIWIDEISDVQAWRAEFLKPEAKEVVEAVGAWVYCFRQTDGSGANSEVESAMKAIQAVVEEHAGYGGDNVMLAVVLRHEQGSSKQVDGGQYQLEDSCMDYGFELINAGAEGVNEYGEKVGFARLKEALEANDWTTTADEGDELNLDDLDLDTDENFGVFGPEEGEMTAELYGVKTALFSGDDLDPTAEDLPPQPDQATQVDGLDKILDKLLAVKEQSADLPEAQRKRIAAQAVRDLLGPESHV